MDQVKIASAVKQLREIMELNQTDFAKHVFNATLATQRYERGGGPPLPPLRLATWWTLRETTNATI